MYMVVGIVVVGRIKIDVVLMIVLFMVFLVKFLEIVEKMINCKLEFLLWFVGFLEWEEYFFILVNDLSVVKEFVLNWSCVR